MSIQTTVVHHWTCDGCGTQRLMAGLGEPPDDWFTGLWDAQHGVYGDHCAECHQARIDHSLTTPKESKQ